MKDDQPPNHAHKHSNIHTHLTDHDHAPPTSTADTDHAPNYIISHLFMSNVPNMQLVKDIQLYMVLQSTQQSCRNARVVTNKQPCDPHSWNIRHKSRNAPLENTK